MRWSIIIFYTVNYYSRFFQKFQLAFRDYHREFRYVPSMLDNSSAANQRSIRCDITCWLKLENLVIFINFYGFIHSIFNLQQERQWNILRPFALTLFLNQVPVKRLLRHLAAKQRTLWINSVEFNFRSNHLHFYPFVSISGKLINIISLWICILKDSVSQNELTAALPIWSLWWMRVLVLHNCKISTNLNGIKVM